MYKINGFHLIELLITLTIIGLLTALSIPLYSHHLASSRRIMAETTLIRLGIALEQYQIEQHSLTNVTLEKLGFSHWEGEQYYQLALQIDKGDDYVLSATPLGVQARLDVACGVLKLDVRGEKGATGGIQNCW